MLGPLPLILFCSAKIVLDDFRGIADPAAGFCGGVSGFDCICPPGDSTSTNDGLNNAKVDFSTWWSSLDDVALPDFVAETDEIDEPGPPDQAPHSVKREVEVDAALEKRRPPPIKILEDGSRVLFDSDRLRSREGEEIPECVDLNDNCSWWAEIGECYKNPGYLIQNCPKACNYCRAALPREVRCKRDPDALPLVQSPGGLNRMFESIVENAEFTERYNTQVMSRDPWILQFDNFAEPGDWDKIEGMLAGTFEGSTVVGGPTEDGKIGRQTLGTRTSKNAWCMQSPCLHSQVHSDLQNRLTELLGVGSPAYMESLQVLKYEVGQFYNSHHDTITDQITMMSGPRMLTAFIYFSEVEGGGHTEFNRLGFKVTPKPGRMVLWPSQKDEDSTQVDDRTYHEACNVTKGHKYAANLWVHLYDYQTPYVMGCAG